jgi:hypothetical protein
MAKQTYGAVHDMQEDISLIQSVYVGSDGFFLFWL